MEYILALIGLVLGIWGSGVIIRGEILGSNAAQIKAWFKNNPDKKIKGGFPARAAFWLARRYGSSKSIDQQPYLSETYPSTVWGFALVLFGFVFQVAAVGLAWFRS